ncbi:MAG: hypothetical protein IJ499_02355 [Clostridia bacterium]|nr:hypothetical protein [Clostridia bacterium]
METGTKRINIGGSDNHTKNDIMAETKKMGAVGTPIKEDSLPEDATRLNLHSIPHSYEKIDETKLHMAPQPIKNESIDATRINMTAPHEPIKPHYTEYRKTELTQRGKKFFWTGFALTLPIIALIVVAYFGLYALCMCSVAALIVACFAVVGIIVIAGSLICLVGLVFGIITLFSSVGIGIYEIGFSVIVSGITLLLGVGVYLLATTALPYLLRQLSAFFKHTLAQVPTLLDRIKEECNHL